MDNAKRGRKMFRAADQLDVTGWAKHLTEDVHFRFGNAEEIHGRTAVQDAIGPFFESIAGLRHDVLRDWSVDDTVIQEMTVTYTRHDGSTLTIPAVNVLRFRDDAIAEYRIYADTSGLYA